MRYWKFIFIVLLVPALVSAQSSGGDGVIVDLNVDACNNNNICESGLGENALNCPNDCSPIISGGGGGGGGTQIFYDVTVVPGYTSAVITWRTYNPMLTTLRWGTNVEYRSGILRSILFLREHSATLTGLQQNTKYYFSLEGQGLDGSQPYPYFSFFTTLLERDTTPPQNPLGIRATANKNSITVRWTNPPDEDFTRVRVMRSDTYFSPTPFDGKLVYEGRGQYVTDADVVVGKKYFYTLFALDRNGNFSSGVGAWARISLPPKGGGGQVVPEKPIVRPIKNNLITTISIFQNGSELPIKDNSCDVNGDHQVEVFVTIDGLPKQQLWLELKNQNGEELGYYLFSYDAGTQKYRVKLPGLLKKGDYPITVFGYIERTETELWRGTLRVSYDSLSLFQSGDSPKSGYAGAFVYAVFFILLVLICYELLKRFRSKKKQMWKSGFFDETQK